MDPRLHRLFNAAYTPTLFKTFMDRLTNQLGPFPFRVAETPLMFTPALRDRLVKHSREIVAQLSEPEVLARLKSAIPAKYDVPGMDSLPNCVQVDFALVEGENGELEGKVIELQAFPSLYALMTFMAEAWGTTLNEQPELKEDWTCFVDLDRTRAVDLMRRTIVANCAPDEVVLVDYKPENQKTAPDFEATRQLLGVDTVCLTKIIKRGAQLFREKDGKEIPIKRIYNRMVFDELEVAKAQLPWDWNEQLDVTWCSHPNWYWVWSKFSLPYLNHPAVPRARLLSEIAEIPEDLTKYVLKPLFSFAGSGVIVDVTPEDVARVPADQRHGWVLQEKVEYAPVLKTPDGVNSVKAEIRVMLLRPPDSDTLTPLILLVRLSRGKMLGVDQNKGLDWVGGSVGIWPR